MDKRTVYRVQDKEGRGPWRPGLSRRWIEVDGPPLPPALHDDFGWAIYDKMARFGHYGSAVANVEDLQNWFTASERKKLAGFGFFPVCILADEILAESPNQIVIRCDRPLHDGALSLPWSAVEARSRQDANQSSADQDTNVGETMRE
jgi:hypothetical protein